MCSRLCSFRYLSVAGQSCKSVQACNKRRKERKLTCQYGTVTQHLKSNHIFPIEGVIYSVLVFQLCLIPCHAACLKSKKDALRCQEKRQLAVNCSGRQRYRWIARRCTTPHKSGRSQGAPKFSSGPRLSRRRRRILVMTHRPIASLCNLILFSQFAHTNTTIILPASLLSLWSVACAYVLSKTKN